MDEANTLRDDEIETVSRKAGNAGAADADQDDVDTDTSDADADLDDPS